MRVLEAMPLGLGSLCQAQVLSVASGVPLSYASG